MKKFIGVIVAVMLCACLLVPTAFAADESSIVDALQGADLGALNADEISALLGDLDLSEIDIDSIVAEFEGEDSNDAIDALNGIADQMNSVQAQNSGDGTTTSDLEAILKMIPVDFDITPIAEMLGSLTDGGLSSLVSSIGSIFGGKGINLASSEVGTFDIANLGTSGDLAVNATNLTAGIADTLVGVLEGLGLDSSVIEGLLDNEIVNFFANMYIGFIGEVEETTAAPTTTKPAVVTTTTPKTGDTSAVIVALTTLTVASGAAFVCLRKKEEA